jgi:phage terminase small subunit
MAELTAKQRIFVAEYLKDLNATQAAIRAGYSDKSAGRIAGELLEKTPIRAAIDAALAAREERTQIDADYVLRQAVKLHERCMQEVEPFTDRKGNPILDEHGRPVFSFNAAGAAKALELVGKHVRVKAFEDQVKNTIEGSVTITVNTGVPRAPDE